MYDNNDLKKNCKKKIRLKSELKKIGISRVCFDTSVEIYFLHKILWLNLLFPHFPENSSKFASNIREMVFQNHRSKNSIFKKKCAIHIKNHTETIMKGIILPFHNEFICVKMNVIAKTNVKFSKTCHIFFEKKNQRIFVCV